MKTLTEVHEEMEEKDRLRTEKLEMNRDILLKKSEEILPLDGREKHKEIYRRTLSSNDFKRTPNLMLLVACDNCGTELIDKSAGSIKGYPPKKHVVCVGCGFSGYLRV
jgi:hypothetical protein